MRRKWITYWCGVLFCAAIVAMAWLQKGCPTEVAIALTAFFGFFPCLSIYFLFLRKRNERPY